jgi:hypothetical protein
MNMDEFTQLIKEIYAKRHINLHQAQQLEQLLWQIPADQSLHLAHLRLQNDIANGKISSAF